LVNIVDKEKKLIFNTTEIRWFVTGQIPNAVDGWFDNCSGDWYAQPERTDTYYRLSEGNSLGIKLRQGRLELKERTGPGDLVRIQKDIIGLIEPWRKWSFELAGELDARSWDRSADRFWLAVKKTRKVRFYRLTTSGPLMPQDFAQGSVCQVELTSVLVQDIQWWSLGFEASGEEANQRELLMTVVEKLLEHTEGIHLSEIDSMSYPQWLEGIPL
jgi:hypothetical protein